MANADQIARRFLEEAERLRLELRSAISDTATDAEVIFAAHALRNTGRMARGVRAVVAGDSAIVTVEARNPQTGFDYVGVTRFGHRSRNITPTHPPKAARFYPKTAKAFPLPFGFRRSITGFAALKMPFGYRRSVRGFHPSRDWAEGAMPEVQKVADERLGKLGREFAVRVSR